MKNLLRKVRVESPVLLGRFTNSAEYQLLLFIV